MSNLTQVNINNYPNLSDEEKDLLNKYHGDIRRFDTTTGTGRRLGSVLDLGIAEEKLKELAWYCRFLRFVQKLVDIPSEQIEEIVSVLIKYYKLTNELDVYQDDQIELIIRDLAEFLEPHTWCESQDEEIRYYKTETRVISLLSYLGWNEEKNQSGVPLNKHFDVTVWAIEDEDIFALECHKSGSLTKPFKNDTPVQINNEFYYVDENANLIRIDVVNRQFETANGWYFINDNNELVGPKNEFVILDAIATS